MMQEVIKSQDRYQKRIEKFMMMSGVLVLGAGGLFIAGPAAAPAAILGLLAASATSGTAMAANIVAKSNTEYAETRTFRARIKDKIQAFRGVEPETPRLKM